MHAQIRNVIDRLQWFSREVVLVELSAGEQTPLGRLVGRLYYQTSVMDVVDRDSRWGYPHNGGSHTFTYKGSPRDAVAMLELFKETLAENFTLNAEESQVASEFSYISQEILAGRRKM
jgi:hypothetical protein